MKDNWVRQTKFSRKQIDKTKSGKDWRKERKRKNVSTNESDIRSSRQK